MNEIGKKPRGRPFTPGNPGRHPGSKNKITRIIEQLAEGEAEQLIEKALELARAGDVQCLRMFLDRLWPARKGQALNISLPPINTSQDVLAAIPSVWDAIRQGRLTPEEASSLAFLIDRSIRAIEAHDVSKRLDDLKKDGIWSNAKGERDYEKNCP